jgi:hypothetical protein
VAGYFGIGDLEGPVCYNKDFHKEAYKFGYEMGHSQGKARTQFLFLLSERPYFYGMERRPKPREEREKLLLRLRVFYGLSEAQMKILEQAHEQMDY